MNSPTLTSPATQARRDSRHRGLHGAGAGEGQGRRQARRHLGVRRACSTRCSPGSAPSKATTSPTRWPRCCKDTPDCDALPALTPSRGCADPRACLERDPRRGCGHRRCPRCDSARSPAAAVGVAWRRGDPRRRVLETVQARLDAAVAQARRHVLVRRVLPLAGLATARRRGRRSSGSLVTSRRRQSPAPSRGFLLGLPEGRVLGHGPGGDGAVAQWQRTGLPHREPVADSSALGEFEMEPVAAADLGQNLQSPVFSPDGKWIAYYSASERVGEAHQRSRRRGASCAASRSR